MTASSVEEARAILLEQLCDGEVPPAIEAIVEDVDVSSLDPDHVLPNLASPLLPGIWFPKGYR